MKKILKKIETFLDEGTDEEILFTFSRFFDRVGLNTQFIENNEGLLTHQVMAIVCGEKIIMSEPQELEWPLQRLPMPESLKGRVN